MGANSMPSNFFQTYMYIWLYNKYNMGGSLQQYILSTLIIRHTWNKIQTHQIESQTYLHITWGRISNLKPILLLGSYLLVGLFVYWFSLSDYLLICQSTYPEALCSEAWNLPHQHFPLLQEGEKILLHTGCSLIDWLVYWSLTRVCCDIEVFKTVTAHKKCWLK